MLSGDKPARDLHEYLFSSSDGRCIFVGKMLNELSAGEKMTWVEKQDLSPEGFIRIFQPETGRSPLPHHYPNKLSYKAISPIIGYKCCPEHLEMQTELGLEIQPCLWIVGLEQYKSEIEMARHSLCFLLNTNSASPQLHLDSPSGIFFLSVFFSQLSSVQCSC